MITIIYIVLLQLLIIGLITSIFYNEFPEDQEKEKEKQEIYLKLQNMTSQEILLFKDKKEFINSIKQYDTIKYFLKGTEEENIKQLINWYYPGYKKL